MIALIKKALRVSSLIAMLLFATSSQSQQHPITYYTELYPPSSYYYNDHLIGLSVDMIKLIWHDLDIDEQPINVVPWARGYKEVTSRPNVALFAMSKTKSRAAKFKWVGPLFTAKYHIIARAKSLQPVSQIESLFEHSIAVVRNDITEKLLNEVEFPTARIVRTSNIANALKLFNAQRVDLLAISNSGLKSAIAQRLMPTNSFEKVYLLASIDDYIAFSKNTPDEIVIKFQKSLNRLTKAHLALKAEYQLD